MLVWLAWGGGGGVLKVMREVLENINYNSINGLFIVHSVWTLFNVKPVN